MRRIGSDMDGVFCAFAPAFSKIINSLYGNVAPRILDYEVEKWDWHKWLPLTEEQVQRAWEKLYTENYFWTSMEMLVDNKTWDLFLNQIGRDKTIDTYFITSRMATGNVSAAYQTARWLELHDWKCPQVIADKRKGILCKALEIEYMIDDSGKNCLDIAEKSPETKIYLLDARHNQKIQHAKVRRIYSVEEYVSDIKKFK